MTLPQEGHLLRIFIGESDRHDGKPLFEAIVHRARERGMAGATVLRGLIGFGAHSRMHTAKILRLSEDLPIVVEIVDKPGAFYSFGDTRLGQGRENSKEFLRQNPDMALELETIIRQKALGGELVMPLDMGEEIDEE